MNLEDYFDILSPDDIRLNAQRIQRLKAEQALNKQRNSRRNREGAVSTS